MSKASSITMQHSYDFLKVVGMRGKEYSPQVTRCEVPFSFCIFFKRNERMPGCDCLPRTVLPLDSTANGAVS